MSSGGIPLSRYNTIQASAGGTGQFFTADQHLVYVTCSLGDTFGARHVTQVTLQRQNLDNYWVGTVISSFNQ